MAFRDAARRILVIAFAAVAVAGYVLTSSLLIGADWFRASCSRCRSATSTSTTPGGSGT